MQQLPSSPDLSHLKRQAKSLLRSARTGDTAALQRFIDILPDARGATLATLATRELKLHDAQSVIAREYGFKSWAELRRYVEWSRTTGAERVERWLRAVYDGNAGARRIALRALREQPALFKGNSWVACAIGDVDVLRGALTNAAWVNDAGGPLAMPPLVAVTHSRLIAEPELQPKLLASAQLLLDAGANVDSAWINPAWPDGSQSALYGAAGVTHNVAMTRLLLAAGANPNDNESLYHSVETIDSTCTRLLLNAGARVSGTNALGRVLDYDRLDVLRLLLDHGGDANERPWLHHAILRGRSIEHIRMLLDAGADLRAVNDHGVSLFRFAQAFGRADVVQLLREAGIDEPLDDTEEFVAACARGDEPSARAILVHSPGMLSRLTRAHLRTMPELAGTGNISAVRTMLAVGWPLEIQTAWDATALNLAVYRGDAEMTELLMRSGADWRTPHGYGDNVIGTLSFASQDETMELAAPRDYAGCARALLAHGVPAPSEDDYAFSDEVTAVFDAWRAVSQDTSIA